MAKKLIACVASLVLMTAALPAPFLHAQGSGAGFTFSPSTGSYVSGSRFSVAVAIDTKGNAINAAEGTITFPRDLLKVVSIAKTNSIFKFWVQDPQFSNVNGTIDFSGGLPTPGYAGAKGRMFTITFQALGPGSAKLGISNGSILANDGEGTNIFAFTGDTLYQIGTAVQHAPQPASTDTMGESFGVPDAPALFSRTHPNVHQWYSVKSFEIAWNLPDDVDAVNYAFVRKSNYALDALGKGRIDHAVYDLSGMGDGPRYFYARFHNKSGWGPVASRPVLIDMKPPEPFGIVRTNSDDETSPRPTIAFSTTDVASPISKYAIRIDGGIELDAATMKQGSVYILPPLLPGDHKVAVRAYDSAGNYTDSMIETTVKPLVSPEILAYSPDVAPPQKPFVVSGMVPQHAKTMLERVVVTLKSSVDSNVFEVPVASDGTWSATFSNRLKASEYSLTAYLTDERGARSVETGQKVVKAGAWLSDVFASIGELSMVGAGIVIGFGIIIGLAIFFYSRLLIMRKRFFSDVRKFEKKLDTNLEHLDEDLKKEHKAGAVHLSDDIAKVEKDIRTEIKNLKDLHGE